MDRRRRRQIAGTAHGERGDARPGAQQRAHPVPPGGAGLQPAGHRHLLPVGGAVCAAGLGRGPADCHSRQAPGRLYVRLLLLQLRVHRPARGGGPVRRGGHPLCPHLLYRQHQPVLVPGQLPAGPGRGRQGPPGCEKADPRAPGGLCAGGGYGAAGAHPALLRAQRLQVPGRAGDALIPPVHRLCGDGHGEGPAGALGKGLRPHLAGPLPDYPRPHLAVRPVYPGERPGAARAAGADRHAGDGFGSHRRRGSGG